MHLRLFSRRLMRRVLRHAGALTLLHLRALSLTMSNLPACSHFAAGRPCQRCKNAGKAETCMDVQVNLHPHACSTDANWHA